MSEATPQLTSSVSIAITGKGEDMECKYSGDGTTAEDVGWRLAWALTTAKDAFIGGGSVWEAIAIAIEALSEAGIDVEYEGRDALIDAACAMPRSRDVKS